ncbi:hypothetical protein ABPG75_000891 [Micractinium tetrahymenae]
MPLVLAVHTVPSVSANVPFAVILLQDAIAQRRTPEGLRCRQLVPSSGSKSVSLWDVRDPEELQHWLDETINVDVTHEVFEVQEEFAIGLGEIARARAAEKVVGGTKEVAAQTGRALGVAATTVGAQINEVDHKLRISERASAAGTAIKESAVGRSTTAALTKVGSALGAGTKKVLENDKVHSATEAVGTSFKKLGASLSSLTGRRSSMRRNGSDEGSGGAERTPQFVQTDDVSYDAPPASAAGSVAPPPAGVAPPPAPAPSPLGDGARGTAAAAATASPAAQEAKFALDDDEALKP